MKNIILSITAIVAASSFAFADYNLANNQKAVVCYGEDNQSWSLNAKRTALKYVVEGESLGPVKVKSTHSDGNTFVAYTSSEGTLKLADQGDTFQFADDENSQPVSCE